MKIDSFRIKNYRSIKDSGICFLSGDNVTILAGLNESGKSSILEALEDFNINMAIRSEAIPQYDEEAMPEIAITFELDEIILHEMFSKVGLTLEEFFPTKIEIIKKYPNNYSISRESITEVIHQMEKEIRTAYNFIIREMPIVIDDIPNYDQENAIEFRPKLIDFWNIIRDSLKNIEDEEIIRDKYNNLTTLLNNLINIDDMIIAGMKQNIPNFILFSSFEDKFPSIISLTDARSNELIKDLSIISDLNLDLIRSASPHEKMKHKEKLNLQLKHDYKKYWKQDITNLHIDWDNENINFFIKEGEDFYSPEMRSKGKQWHLAFYIKISARSKEDVKNVILIDEPGLYLHAKAQKDNLDKLEDSAKYAQIIFSTHSPYLIEIDKLSRIRLISRTNDESGTTISNKIHKNADKETLTPIITAIGLDLSMGLDIAKDNNIIVEGISDYYYLNAFIELLNFEFKKDVHIIPIQGADKFKFLVPLMLGWGLNYCTVLDNDTKGRKVEKELIKNFGHTGIKTIFISENEDEEVEDLFDRNDFINLILNENVNAQSLSEKNSQLLKQKDNGFDKVLLAKLFNEKTKNGDVTLSDQTTENFRKLLVNIDKLIFENN